MKTIPARLLCPECKRRRRQRKRRGGQIRVLRTCYTCAYEATHSLVNAYGVCLQERDPQAEFQERQRRVAIYAAQVEARPGRNLDFRDPLLWK